jgi:hypothetical protein
LIGLPVPEPPSPKFQLEVVAPGVPPELVLVKVTISPGQTDVSDAVKLTVGSGYTVITIVFTVVVDPLCTVRVHV